MPAVTKGNWIKRLAPCALAVGIAWLFAACGGESNTSPAPEPEMSVNVCRAGTITPIPASQLGARQAQGDYVTTLIVSPKITKDVEGVTFTRISDALAAARTGRLARGERSTASCRITIEVAAGEYRGSLRADAAPSLEKWPLVIDVPMVSLIGALKMQLDEKGRATGISTQGAGESTLIPSPLRNDTNAVIVINGHPDGSSAGHGAVVEGFAIRSGHVGVDSDSGGFGVFVMRVKDVMVRGNRFEPALLTAIDFRSASGTLANNYSSGGTVCDMCVAGPGSVTVSGNRMMQGGVDGIIVNPTVVLPVPPQVEQLTPPSVVAETALVINNHVRDHLRAPAGVGIRVVSIAQGAPNPTHSVIADIRNNDLTNNWFGFLFEAGFPLANTTLKGDMDITLKGNVVLASCQADAFIAFTRHVTALGIGQPTRPTIRNSTYRITLNGNLPFSTMWYSNPSGFGNQLVVDGLDVPAGARMAYDASKTCS